MSKPQKLRVPQLIDALRKKKGMVYLAADALSVHPGTIYNYIKRYPTVRQVVEDERGKFVDTAELALNRAVLDGQGWAVCFALKTLGKSRGYIERQEVDAIVTTSNPDAPIVRTIAALTGGSGGDLQPSSEDENAVDGTPVGEDNPGGLARNNGSSTGA